jgi:hypothetical protein
MIISKQGNIVFNAAALTTALIHNAATFCASLTTG